MKKTILNPFFQAMIVIALIISVYSCSEDNATTPQGPDANTINGTVSFVDTNFILSGGTYLISAYPSASWPPTGGPAAFDTIKITRSNNILNLNYTYKLKDVSPGDYVVSVGFRKATGGQSPIMSVYGCDTARAITGSMCFLNPTKKATIGSNNQGTENINMLSWSDTTKKVY